MKREEIEEQIKNACSGFLKIEDRACYLGPFPNKWFMHSKLYDLTTQLIREHFDNPPLRFEELEEGVWVWDNKEKMFCKIVEVLINKISVNYHYAGVLEFEENRFYRKEVKE